MILSHLGTKGHFRKTQMLTSKDGEKLEKFLIDAIIWTWGTLCKAIANDLILFSLSQHLIISVNGVVFVVIYVET